MVSFTLLQKNPIVELKKLSITEIGDVMEKASDAYYNKGKQLLTDDVFDMVKEYLRGLDPAHPALFVIGAPVHGTKVDLPFWMGSLEKIRDDPKALGRWISKYPGTVVVSDKLDGNSGMAVYYSDGSVRLYSRGDGYIGQDVSGLVEKIRGLPKSDAVFKLPFVKAPVASAKKDNTIVLAVRGEIIISKAGWEKIKHKGAMARNVAAGAMHAKKADPDITKYLDFVAYELMEPKALPHVGLGKLAESGFLVTDNAIMSTENMTMDSLSQRLIRRRQESEYEIDGLVVIHNEMHKVVKGKNPAYGFAIKTILTHDEAEVIVTEVEWNVSKDGFLKPLVKFDPVQLSGASIRKATGFNAQFIEQNVIGPGAHIVIIRSGDVIPYIVRVLQKATEPSFPTIPWKWNETHVDAVLNASAMGSGVEGTSEVAKDMQLKKMEHFISHMGVKGVGSGLLAKMYDNGVITIKQLVHVKVAELVKMSGIQQKTADNIYEALEKVRKPKNCVDLMVSCNLFGRGLGKKKIELVVKAFPDIVKEKTPTYEQVVALDGMGSVFARQFVDQLPEYYAFVKDIGVTCSMAAAAPVAAFAAMNINANATAAAAAAPKPALSITVVFTGFRDTGLEEALTLRGGKVTTSVSKNTSVVVAKDPSDESGKVTKAKSLGIPVMTATEFKKTYNF